LLLPWSASLLDATDDRAALGLAFRPDLGITKVLHFQSGPNGGGVAGWGLLIAAGAALLISNGPRLAWVTRAWIVAIVGYAVVVVPAALVPDSATAAPEAGLALAALGIAVAAGLAFTAFGELLSQARVGWPQAAGALAVVGIVVASFGFVGDIFNGKWHAPDSWAPTLSFTEDALHEGQFRILWVGDPASLPLDPVEVDATLSWSMTRNGPGDARELVRAPVTAEDRVIDHALLAARAGQTSRLGRMLAPAGVRYVALALRNGIGGERGREPPGVSGALGNQLDLARLGSEPGLVLYENLSWVPARAVVAEKGTDPVPIGDVDPLSSTARTNLDSAQRVGRAPVGPGTLLLAEAYDEGWSATARGKALPHGRAFGFTNSFTLDAKAGASFEHSGQSRRYGLLFIESALWIVAITWWFRGLTKRPKVRERTDREERRERKRAFDELELGDEFWEGG
jgi:hypothetical protein